MFGGMVRVIASLLLFGLVIAIGCKKDTPEENVKPSEPSASTRVHMFPMKSASTPPECRGLCMMVGKCTYRDGKCLATSKEACKRAIGCKTAGLCEVKDEKCLATTNEHCERSELCATQGRCIAIDGRCENKNVMPAVSVSAAGSGK